MNAPPTFNTGDPSYRMAASTPGSANPTAFTAANGSRIGRAARRVIAPD